MIQLDHFCRRQGCFSTFFILNPHQNNPPPTTPLPNQQTLRGFSHTLCLSYRTENSGHGVKRFSTRLNIYIILFFPIVIPVFFGDYGSPRKAVASYGLSVLELNLLC